jgi:hypothetical protein
VAILDRKGVRPRLAALVDRKRLVDRLRGPASLVVLSAHYVMGPPDERDPDRPAWRTVGARMRRAAAGAAEAIRIGAQVRSAPVLRSVPSLLAMPDELTPVCTLISDTHVTAPGHALCELESDPGQWPWRDRPNSEVVAGGLRRILQHARRHGPRTVIWCGDEVDSGTTEEWQQWRRVVDAVPRLSHRLVPGNHDICFNRPFDADYTLARRATRENAYQAHAGRLADFPVVDTLITDAGPVTLILLDSCRHRSTHILSNAVGKFGDDQLGELARILAHSAGPSAAIRALSVIAELPAHAGGIDIERI